MIDVRTLEAQPFAPTARAAFNPAPWMGTLPATLGDTRPAPFGCTRDGDAIEVRRSGFAVDVNTDTLPLDVLDAKLAAPPRGEEITERLAPSVRRPYIPRGADQQGRVSDGRRAVTHAEQRAEIEAVQRAAGVAMCHHTSEPMPLHETAADRAWAWAAEIVGFGLVGLFIYAVLRSL